MDQVPEATGEWGEKKYPGKGREWVLSRNLGPHPHQVQAQFTGGLTLGSLCPLVSLADCKGREYRGYHRELVVPFHSCADTLPSLGDAEN